MAVDMDIIAKQIKELQVGNYYISLVNKSYQFGQFNKTYFHFFVQIV